MLTILFIADISGQIGRRAVAKILPNLKKQLKPDLIIANVDNLAHGKGVTPKTLQEILSAGVDYCTGGDHCFDQTAQINKVYNGGWPILRPANFSPQAPGRGVAAIETKKGKVLLVNLIGRVFMRRQHECPFQAIEKILTNFDEKNFSAILIDIHAEATSEKLALALYLDGRASAVLGTHTHIPTADGQILAGGTAYITDVGMVGFSAGVLGLDKKGVIASYLTQIKHKHIFPEKGWAVLQAVVVKINPKTRKAKSLKTINKTIKIN